MREAAFLDKGKALAAQKQYARAMLEFRNAIQIMPRDAEPYYQLGVVCMKAGFAEDAYRAFHRATELNPKHAPAQIKLAELLGLTRRNELLQEAASRLENVLVASPDNEEATEAMALTEFRMGNHSAANRRLEEALRKFPSHLQSSVALARIRLADHDLNGARDVLVRAVAAAPESPAPHIAVGQLFMLLGRPDQAEPEIRKAVQLDPRNGPALLSLALLQISANQRPAAEQTLRRLSALPGQQYKDVHALFLYNTGQKDAGVSELEALLREDRTDLQARTRLAAMYLDTDRADKAVKLLGNVLERNPHDTEALFQRSQAYLRQGKAEQAEQDLKLVLHYQPDSAPAHLALARAYRMDSLADRGREEMTEALHRDKDFLPARLALAKEFVRANQPHDALNVLDEASAAQKKTTGFMVARNWALLQAGNTGDLRASINQALRGGRTPELVLQDGLLRMKEKDYAGARAAAEEVVRTKPQDSRGARLLADSYLALNDAPAATQRLAQLAASNPKSAPLQQLLGQWYLKNGQLPEASKAFEAALAADPRLVQPAINLAEIDRHEHRFEAAQQRLHGVLAREPRNVYALLLLASISSEAGDRRGEIAAYRSVIGIDSSNVLALNNLAWALEAEDSDEALTLAQRAVELAPDDPAAQDTLGWICYRKHMYDNAVMHLKAAVDRGPSPQREYHLAMSYVKTGHPDSGAELLRDAIRQDPNLAAAMER